MRQSHLLLLLVLLLVAGGAVVWMALQAGPPPTNAGGGNAVAIDAGRTPVPEAPQSTGQPATRPPSQPQPRPEPSVDSTPEDEYRVRGRVAFNQDIQALLPFLGDIDEYSVLVGCYPPEVEQPETIELMAEFSGDHSFELTISKEDLAFEPAIAISALHWCVTMDVLNDPWLSTEGNTAAPKGGVAASATITGNVIDLGTITLGLDTFAREQWVVTGRLVHNSGRALRHSGGHVMYFAGGDGESGYFDMEDFGTNEEGRFFCVESLPDMADPLQCRFSICLCDENSDMPAANLRLGKPEVRGNLIDFGDVKIGGSVLEIVAKMDPTPPIELRRTSLRNMDWACGNESPLSEISLWCGEIHINRRLPPAPQSVVIWVPEGIYHYSAEARHSGNYYLPVTGRVEIPQKAVVKLELAMKAAETVPVRVLLPDGTAAPDISVEWRIRQKAQDCRGYADGEVRRVPVVADARTEVTAVADGYESIDGHANLGDKELVLQLDKSTAKTSPDCGVRVLLPELPAGVKPDQFPCGLEVWNDEFMARLQVNLKPGGDHVVEVTVKQPGRYSVALLGGDGWGYPSRRISGPVEVEIASGPFREVALPPIAPPPWDKKVEHAFARVAVAGRPASVTGPFLAADDSPLGEVRLSDGFALRTTALPMYLLDGDRRIALTYTPPQEGAREGNLTLELPASIEVRVTRMGGAVDVFAADCTTKPKDSEYTHKCSNDATDGIAMLWAPAGTARVRVHVGRETLSRDVKVVPGAVQQVEIAFDRVAVQFNVAEPDLQPRADVLWRILRYDETGQVGTRRSHELDESELKYMEVGRYRLLPAAGGKPELAFDLDLSDGKDRTVELPSQAGAVAARVCLSLPEALSKELNDESDIYFQAISMTDPESVRLSRRGTRWREELAGRAVPGGVIVPGLFTGADVCLQGIITLHRDDKEIMWLLKPFRLKVTGDDMTVKVEWAKAVPLHEHWDMTDMRYASLVGGCWVPLEQYYGALPGNHEVLFFDGEEVIHREWITFRGDKPMRLPQTVINVLVEKEIAEPQDFEDEEE